MAQAAYSFVRDDHPAFGKQIPNVSEAHIEAMIGPHRITDDLRRKTMPRIA
jgi:hypothetical protein